MYQPDRSYICARRSTLAVLPILGLPFLDSQSAKQPRTTSVNSTKSMPMGPHTVSDSLTTDISQLGAATCASDVSLDGSHKSVNSNCQPAAARHRHRAPRVSHCPTEHGVTAGQSTLEDMLECDDQDASCTTAYNRPCRATAARHPRWLGRTPSWPSALIRVKERIMEKVSRMICKDRLSGQ